MLWLHSILCGILLLLLLLLLPILFALIPVTNKNDNRRRRRRRRPKDPFVLMLLQSTRLLPLQSPPSSQIRDHFFHPFNELGRSVCASISMCSLSDVSPHDHLDSEGIDCGTLASDLYVVSLATPATTLSQPMGIANHLLPAVFLFRLIAFAPACSRHSEDISRTEGRWCAHV